MGVEYKSRTQKKKEDRALQRLGEQLIALPSSQLKAMDLPDELLTAIELAHKIKSRSGKCFRQRNFAFKVRGPAP